MEALQHEAHEHDSKDAQTLGVEDTFQATLRNDTFALPQIFSEVSRRLGANIQENFVKADEANDCQSYLNRDSRCLQIGKLSARLNPFLV